MAKDNLGTTPGLFAGAALMIDYVLTVAVSVSSGVAAVLSFLPHYQQYHIELAVCVVIFIALANLRGVRESGALFALPTYVFVGSALTLVAMGVYRIFTDAGFAVPPPPAGSVPEPVHLGASGLLLGFLILRAFASGCAAMTGTEAVSNGLPAFRPPESKNAATTSGDHDITAGDTVHRDFLRRVERSRDSDGGRQQQGTRPCRPRSRPRPSERTGSTISSRSPTALILILAANTSFRRLPAPRFHHGA